MIIGLFFVSIFQAYFVITSDWDHNIKRSVSTRVSPKVVHIRSKLI